MKVRVRILLPPWWPSAADLALAILIAVAALGLVAFANTI